MLRLSAILTASLLFLSHVPVASASLVSVTNRGSVEWNVLPAKDEILASSPKPDVLTVQNVAHTSITSTSPKISLDNSDGKITLLVDDGTTTQEANVTGYTEEIVEIEQHVTPSKIAILANDDGFLIRDDNVTAFTHFPLTVEPEIKSIVVETSSGKHYLGVLPSAALAQVVKGQMLDVVGEDGIRIIEEENGELEYSVTGKKTIDILNIFQYEVPVTVAVSILDGQIISVDQPIWLPFAAFLFA